MLSKDKEIKGLFIRHGKLGDTYIYNRNIKGKTKRHSLGSTELYTKEQARKWALGLNQDAAGVARNYTLSEIADKAVERATVKGNRRPNYLRDSITLYAPDWLNRSLADITKGMVSDRHDRVATKRGIIAASRFVTVLRTLYNIAEKNDYEGRNPTKNSDIEITLSKPRQVVWTDAQMDAFMKAAESDDEFWHSLFTVIAWTGMRKMNCCTMEWSEINGDAWTIPASKFKTKKAHTVHLHPKVMQALVRRKNDSQWVFPSPTDLESKSPVRSPQHAFERICKAAGVAGVTIHDMRRTLGSKLARKVSIPVVSRALGHAKIETTMRAYVVVDEGDVRAAMMSL